MPALSRCIRFATRIKKLALRALGCFTSASLRSPRSPRTARKTVSRVRAGVDFVQRSTPTRRAPLRSSVRLTRNRPRHSAPNWRSRLARSRTCHAQASALPSTNQVQRRATGQSRLLFQSGGKHRARGGNDSQNPSTAVKAAKEQLGAGSARDRLGSSESWQRRRRVRPKQMPRHPRT